MDIMIEGNKLDFTLEGNEKFSEVIHSIEKWLSNNREIINEIVIDGDTITFEDHTSFEDLSISDVKIVEIKTKNNDDIAVNSLMEVKKYISRFLFDLEETESQEVDNTKKEEINEGIKWVNDVLGNVCKILCVDSNTIFYQDTPLSDLLAKTQVVIVELESNKHQSDLFKSILYSKVKPILDVVREFLPKILNKSIFHFSTQKEFEADNITSNLKEAIETIDAFLPGLPDIGTHLQSGKEFEAFIEIKNVLGMMESLIYYLRKVEELLGLEYATINVEENSVDEINKEFSELIGQFSQALGSNDVVLLGDLLEYELIGKLEIYRRIFEELIVLAEKKSYN